MSEMLILGLRGTPGFRFAREMYRRHRGESTEIHDRIGRNHR